MSGAENLCSESDFVIGGCLYSDCDSCPSDRNNTCPDLSLGSKVQFKKITNASLGDIKKTFLDRGDSL